MNWSAKIIEKSDIDSNGYIDVKVDIYCDDEVMVPSYAIHGAADSIIKTIETKLNELALQVENSDDYEVGDVITI